MLKQEPPKKQAAINTALLKLTSNPILIRNFHRLEKYLSNVFLLYSYAVGIKICL